MLEMRVLKHTENLHIDDMTSPSGLVPDGDADLIYLAIYYYSELITNPHKRSKTMSKLTSTLTVVVLNKSKYVKLSVRVGDKVYDEYCGYDHYRYNEIACESSMLTSILCRATADGQLEACGIKDIDFHYRVSEVTDRSDVLKAIESEA